MTARRHTRSAPQPRLTRGEERPAPACEGRPGPFDELIEHSSGPYYRGALAEARSLCLGGCPLADTCLRANRDEAWAQAVLGRGSRDKQRTAAQRRADEFNEARVADLQALAAAGASADEVCAALGVTRDALTLWCRRNGYSDLWRKIAPPVKAVISRPRKSVAA